jgi:hypothetical protein
VIIVKKWALKVPTINSGWQYFLCGLLANMQEQWLSKITRSGPDAHKLCHVVFRIPLGFLIVMRKAAKLTDEEFAAWRDNYDTFIRYENGFLPIEPKRSSFGWLDGRVGAVDYGCTAQAFSVINVQGRNSN